MKPGQKIILHEAKQYPKIGLEVLGLHEQHRSYLDTTYRIRRLCHESDLVEIVTHVYLSDKIRKNRGMCRSCSSKASQGKRKKTMADRRDGKQKARDAIPSGKKPAPRRARDMTYLAKWMRAALRAEA